MGKVACRERDEDESDRRKYSSPFCAETDSALGSRGSG